MVPFWAKSNWVIWMAFSPGTRLQTPPPALAPREGSCNPTLGREQGCPTVSSRQSSIRHVPMEARPRTSWSDHISQLAWERLRIYHESVAGVKEASTDTQWTLRPFIFVHLFGHKRQRFEVCHLIVSLQFHACALACTGLQEETKPHDKHNKPCKTRYNQWTGGRNNGFTYLTFNIKELCFRIRFLVNRLFFFNKKKRTGVLLCYFPPQQFFSSDYNFLLLIERINKSLWFSIFHSPVYPKMGGKTIKLISLE